MIYAIQDLHLLSKRTNKSFDDYILGRLENFLANIVERNSIVIMAGDIFDSPITYSIKYQKVLEKFIDICIHYSNMKNIKYLMIRGNHDYYKDLVLNDEIGIFSLLSNFSGIGSFTKSYDRIVDLPTFIMANDEEFKICVKELDTCFTLLPYGVVNNTSIITPMKTYSNNILVCHGSLDTEIDKDEDSKIPNDIISLFDIVIKGHIHQRYITKNVYSAGCVVKVKTNQDTGYAIIDNVTKKVELKEFEDDFNIEYKNFICTEDDINNTLSSLKKQDIVSIFYKGRPEVIDIDLMNQCYNTCFDFKIIFENSFKKEVTDRDNLDFEKYLQDNLESKLFNKVNDVIKGL